MNSFRYIIFQYLLGSILLIASNAVFSQSWQPLQSQFKKNITGLYASKSSTVLLATTLSSGIYRSGDAGKSWFQVLDTKDSIFTLEAFNDRILLAGSQGGIYRSLDSGHTWSFYSIGNESLVGRVGVLSSGKILIGTGSVWDRAGRSSSGVMISSDTGKSWQLRNSGIGRNDALIEALAVAKDGAVFIGIHDENAGLKGKYGLFKSVDEGNTWQRVTLSIDLPLGDHYDDSKVRISSVFNIAIAGDLIVAAVVGVYSNFGFAFSIQKPLSAVDNPNVSWTVRWVADNLPSQGSYYEQLVSLHTDFKGRQWASISRPSSETDNNIYLGSIRENQAWQQAGKGLPDAFGRYYFAEDGAGHLYTASYYTGDSIYVLDLNDIQTGLFESVNDEGTFLFPNPRHSSALYLKYNSDSREAIFLNIYDISGKQVCTRFVYSSEPGIYEIIPVSYALPKGYYTLYIQQGMHRSQHKLVLD